MRDEVNSVKVDQTKLLRKSNQIRSGHRKIIKMNQSETSLRASEISPTSKRESANSRNQKEQ